MDFNAGNFNAVDLNMLRPGISMPMISTPQVIACNFDAGAAQPYIRDSMQKAYLISKDLIFYTFYYANVLIQRNEDIWNAEISVYKF